MAAAENERLAAAEDARMEAAVAWGMNLPLFDGQDSHSPALVRHFGVRLGDRGGTPGVRAGEGTRPVITAGPAVGRVQIEPGLHLGDTRLDVGKTKARGRRARVTGATAATADEETLLGPVLVVPPRTATAEPPSPRSRVLPARGKWFPR